MESNDHRNANFNIEFESLIDVGFDIHCPLHAWVPSGEGMLGSCCLATRVHVVLLIALLFFVMGCLVIGDFVSCCIRLHLTHQCIDREDMDNSSLIANRAGKKCYLPALSYPKLCRSRLRSAFLSNRLLQESALWARV